MPNATQFSTKSEINRIIRNRKIPNALLFTGRSGSGKREAAYYFAMAANCRAETNRPCGQCRSCKKIINRMHPDMVTVALPEGKKIISVAQIREMETAVAAKPNEARHRMVLISDAECMNGQAQNALLKSVEEPPRRTFFVLISQAAAALLDTIVSRCWRLRFKCLTGQKLMQHLIEHHGADPLDARIAVETAGSDLQKALMFLNLETQKAVDWKARRQWIIREIIELIKSRNQGRIPQALALSQKLSLDPGSVFDGLAVMRTVFRDLCVVRHSPEKIVNLDFSGVFHDINRIVDENTSLLWMTDLHETERRLLSNSSVRLTLDRFFMGIS